MTTNRDDNSPELEQLREENLRLRTRLRLKNDYIRSKVNELLDVMGTKPLKPEELDDDMLLAMDPLGIIFNSIRHVLTNLKETNARLHLLNEEMSAIFTSAAVGIMVVDSDYRILSYNNSLKDHFFPEIGTEEIKDTHCFQLLCKGNGPPDGECVCRQVAASGGTSRIMGTNIRGHVFDVAASPIKDSRGQIKNIVVVYHDITPLKQAQETLNTINTELEQRVNERTALLTATNRELDAFAYSVSHDLRAPLRGVEGFSTALEEEYGNLLDDTGKDYLCRIRRGCVRMGTLIDDLLKLSRITRCAVSRTPVDLGSIAEKVFLDLQVSEPKRTVAIRIDPGMVVSADPVLIRSALENLLGNAWKFTRHTEQPLIQFSTMESAGERIYFVRDNGAGFNMQYADKLFTAFQRLHRPDEFEGTGIGLASVQRVITMHGGRVWAEGEEGKGATIYFTLGEHES